jgi:hypothetical protein
MTMFSHGLVTSFATRNEGIERFARPIGTWMNGSNLSKYSALRQSTAPISRDPYPVDGAKG